jgi:hypothetical protein
MVIAFIVVAVFLGGVFARGSIAFDAVPKVVANDTPSPKPTSTPTSRPSGIPYPRRTPIPVVPSYPPAE